MISLSSVSFGFTHEAIFKNLTFTFNKFKYGLVGFNGVGKSTLAKLIVGAENPDTGEISVSTSIGYLKQQATPSNITAGLYLINVWESAKYIKLIQSLLLNLDLDQSLQKLSGGEWMRVRLAYLLGEDHDFLILDEPSNNLDRDGKDILLDFIKNYDGGLLLISHDRELLNEVQNIVELTDHGLTLYGGNFDFYKDVSRHEKNRAFEKADHQYQKAKKVEKEQHKKIQQQVKRTHSGRKQGVREGIDFKVVNALVIKAEETLGKIASKAKERLSEAQGEAAHLKQKLKHDPFFKIRFSDVNTNSHKTLASVQNFNWSYSKEHDFKALWKNDISFSIKAQDRIHLSGVNGVGKSTLIKLIKGQSLEGKCIGSLNIYTQNISYLDQNYENLNISLNVLENIKSEAKLTEVEIRNELAFYGFTGDDVFKSISMLSGGEKLKLSLALMIIKKDPPDLIVLDEPTNNLDLFSLELLEKAIQDYKGALLVVSHDTEFCKNINLDKILNLNLEGVNANYT